MTEQPPHSQEAEQAVLGSLLIDRDAMAQVYDWLPHEAFYIGPNRLIYRAMRHLWDRRVPCDTVTLVGMLNEHGKLDACGGPAYLADLMDAVPTSVHLVHYAETVLRHARQRAVMSAASKLVAQAYDGDPDVEDFARQLRDAITPYQPEPTAAALFPDLVAETAELVEARWSGSLSETIVSTGLRDIDRAMHGGVRGGEQMVLAARPGMGKTSMVLKMAAASPSLVVSLEMKRHRLVQRMLAGQAQVGYGVVADGSREPDAHSQHQVRVAVDLLPRLAQIVAIRDDLYTVGAIESYVERLVAEQGLGAVFVDHIGLINDEKSRNDYERISRISWGLKRLAMRTNTAVIVLSQLNRGVEHRPECVPFMSDLRDSGRIEENADVIALLYRRKYYADKGMVTPDPARDWIDGEVGKFEAATFSLVKNRDGAGVNVVLGWRGETMTFYEIARSA